eukprot:Lithocolla_globosa_v1_NODE_7204_length_978_cov_9.431203.p2 type:complete len:122 gc:universal NODE_7204_length_978_cov_9.431203:624-259(-)
MSTAERCMESTGIPSERTRLFPPLGTNLSNCGAQKCSSHSGRGRSTSIVSTVPSGHRTMLTCSPRARATRRSKSGILRRPNQCRPCEHMTLRSSRAIGISINQTVWSPDRWISRSRCGTFE